MYKVKVEGKEYNVEFAKNSNIKGKVNDKDFSLDIIETSTGIYHLLMDDESYHIEILNVDYNTKTFDIKIRNNKYSLEIRDDLDELLHKMGMGNLNTVIIVIRNIN